MTKPKAKKTEVIKPKRIDTRKNHMKKVPVVVAEPQSEAVLDEHYLEKLITAIDLKTRIIAKQKELIGLVYGVA
jgi:hypothetical protein